MTDQQHADAIEKAIANLKNALRAAEDDGLTVELTADEHDERVEISYHVSRELITGPIPSTKGDTS